MKIKDGLLGARTCAMVAATVLSMVCADAARADIILIQSNSGASTEGLGTFTGSIDYAFDAIDGDGRLIITLTNTSPAGNGGFLTGFVFNINSVDANASATLVSGSPVTLINAPNQNGAPFGNPYDGGAALGGNFLDGGNPSAGIAVGATGTFEFEVNACDASTLTASSFLSGPFEYDFLVRFRGFADGGSDKVPAEKAIPGPSAILMACIGILMIGRRRRTA